MIILKTVGLVAAGLLAVGTVFAGEHGDCAKKVGNKDKASCDVTFAKLDLTADQKTKLETAKAECDKAGCTEASMTKFKKDAEGILSKDQYATFKAECEKADSKKEKTQT
jgi:hypothetical protein